MSMRLRRALHGLHARLLLSYLLVIAVGLVTLYAAASLAAPRFFERHMLDIARQQRAQGIANQGTPGGPPGRGPGLGRFGVLPADMEDRVADGYLASLRDSLVLAGGAALATAVVASVLVSRGIASPIYRLAMASRRLAAGHYGERVAVDGTTEVRQLAASFNAMAMAVEDAERRRQELIGDVAHEMRTPIATLEGYLEGLLDDVIEPSDRVWAKLHAEAGRLRRLIEDLQELSRAEAHQLSVACRPVSPSAIVKGAVERLEDDVTARGLALHVDVPSMLPMVQADPDRAIQVLTNLLTNALRYTPPPGVIKVTAALRDGLVRFEVADTGVGIAPEHLGRIFERFYRVDKSRSRTLGGAGVGLTIAQALVEEMGGQLRATSPGSDCGSTFTFDLPIAS
jgi:two-component system sensor histidine kinase BaeS